MIHRRNIFKNGTGFHAESMQEKRKICNALPRGHFEFILIKFIKMTKGEVSPSLPPEFANDSYAYHNTIFKYRCFIKNTGII
ncbi:hypothetical protein HMPREF0860_1543 [Treponema socranskii subsp. socranskii VPI DR56BR1116 = ATCC 35536]|uniref:Uncharacterized protein n=1 Tax=Treponema socranskii subsp. socranskii VPI DR56BR1116 = ATCC 35536 TaxID=1125725 RepID=U1GQR2_TRESO|nr:hypothetical protein HMPREF1325_2479 [Treponema socranskii subsp. socranskii VPI DR56BR1116 = ATCC 35536]ERK04151.1 hypothetical protein HMPREF0860_1543 [Treponema socranskii subsp. socranskii VPI DR56BR1116 = ATCC 35536]